MPVPRKPERDAALAADYRGGIKQAELCAKYGLSAGRVSQIIHEYGQALSPLGLTCRAAAANRRKAGDPAYRAKMADVTRRAWADGRMTGRRGKA